MRTSGNLHYMDGTQVRMKAKFNIESETAKIVGLKIHEDDRAIWEEWCAREPGLLHIDLSIEYVSDEEFTR